MILGLDYGFMRHALLAASSIAVASAAIGYFVTLRRQAFAAHALSHVGFTGAAGAILLGLSPYLGLFAFTLAAALALGLAGGRLRERDIGIGMVLMFALGLGVLFLNLYTANAQAAMSILFGSIVGITAQQAALSLGVALACLLALAGIYRPLAFASLNPEAARARGVPVRALDLLFIALVAAVVAIAVPVIGALLIFAFLIGPAAAAQALTRGMARGVLLAMVLALLLTWAGLAAAYYIGYPSSTWIASLSFALYVAAQFMHPADAPGIAS
ncbi:MAG: metal ABC transporter permease [Proteobacteria bacterium]|nr:metal ABC transporter permease [Pseudomonadota bacterium]